MSPSNDDRFRYGVFLQPDPAFASECIKAMLLARYQYGLPAAIGYPAHITVVGSIALDPDRYDPDQPLASTTPSPREQELIDAVSTALADQEAFTISTAGITHSDNHYLQYRFRDGETGKLAQLMGKVLEAARPLRVFHDGDWSVEQRRRDAPENFRAHLTLVGHDGQFAPNAVAEALRAFRALGLDAPREMRADTLTLYRISSMNWQGEYWHDMEWSLVKGWHLD